MIYKRAKRVFIIALSLLILIMAIPSAAAQAQETLLVCDSQSEMEELSALILACGKRANAVLREDYLPEMMEEYALLITTSEAALKDAVAVGARALFVGSKLERGAVKLKELKALSVQVFGGGYGSAARFEESISVIESDNEGGFGQEFGSIVAQGSEYPFAVKLKGVTYAPYYRSGDLSFFLLGAVMQDFFGDISIGDAAQGKLYVIIDDVYAFTDLYALCAAADMLYESAIPFIVRIRPMYDNLDFPAFKRYAQVLRYMQAKNGVIVPGEPFVSEIEQEREPLSVKMERFYGALEDEGIAYIDMEHSPLELSIETLQGISPPRKNFGRLSVDAMVNFSISPDEGTMEEELERINALWLTIDDYRRNFTNARYQYHEVSIDDQYEYFHEEEKLFADEFAKGNEVLLAVVGVALMMLLALLLLGRRMNRRKFRKG